MNQNFSLLLIVQFQIVTESIFSSAVTPNVECNNCELSLIHTISQCGAKKHTFDLKGALRSWDADANISNFFFRICKDKWLLAHPGGGGTCSKNGSGSALVTRDQQAADDTGGRRVLMWQDSPPSICRKSCWGSGPPWRRSERGGGDSDGHLIKASRLILPLLLPPGFAERGLFRHLQFK